MLRILSFFARVNTPYWGNRTKLGYGLSPRNWNYDLMIDSIPIDLYPVEHGYGTQYANISAGCGTSIKESSYETNLLL